MDRPDTVNGAYARLPAALDLLERRAILPDGEGYTTRQLARELTRRGWRWSLETEAVSATKAYPPPGAASQTITVAGPDQRANLAIVLAEVIRYDEEHGLSVWKPYRADIVVRAPDDRIIALVEVRNWEDLSSESAVAFRRDLLADNRLDVSIPYFLMVSQDVGYLWDQRSAELPLAKPGRSFSTESVVPHYVPWFSPNERLTGQVLETVMARWLTDLADERPTRPIPADRFFAGTDFLDAIRGATVLSGSRV